MNRNVNLRADLITPNVALSLIPVFTSAYGLAISVVESYDFLSGNLKRQALPYIKNWAVEHEFHRRAKAGTIPFEGDFIWNSRKNHQHVELKKDGFILTVSQTPNIHSVPRDCVFRNKHCLDGQIALAGFEDEGSDKNIYAILTHGCGETAPSFILCGIPSPDMKSWAQHVNLFEVARGMEVIDSSPVTEEIKLTFRDEVEESVRKFSDL
jgi:hypothetical protein